MQHCSNTCTCQVGVALQGCAGSTTARGLFEYMHVGFSGLTPAQLGVSACWFGVCHRGMQQLSVHNCPHDAGTVVVWLLQDTALSIAAMQRDAGLECDDEVYLDSFKPTLMDVFYDWSLGKSFADVGADSLSTTAAVWLQRMSATVCT